MPAEPRVMSVLCGVCGGLIDYFESIEVTELLSRKYPDHATIGDMFLCEARSHTRCTCVKPIMQSVLLVVVPPNGSDEDEKVVTEAVMPHFLMPPDVVVWGTRMFKYRREDGDRLVYSECFGVVVFTKDEMRTLVRNPAEIVEIGEGVEK